MSVYSVQFINVYQQCTKLVSVHVVTCTSGPVYSESSCVPNDYSLYVRYKSPTCVCTWSVHVHVLISRCYIVAK